ncbi:hypothetical protein [Streptomyces violaceoruber]|uniref:Uncharacterized protein n=1 Tax=Streptomyces violaceoruber TaxID=1935 RepID=A0ACD4WXV5_STRVN|nr:hypothetical protein R2E43_34790 [Streptomyces violaceoruber]BDD70235.1 hypothetical protein JCM4020_08550 [Streptomyces coelicolor]
MSVGGFLRVLRAAVFAAVCVVLAALGHVLMSGEGLPGWVLLSGASAVGAVGWAVGAHERRRRTVAGLTVGVQACLHLAFTLAQSGGRPATTPDRTRSLRQWADQFLCGPAPTPAQAARAHDIAKAAGPHHPEHAGTHGADSLASVGHGMASLAGTGGAHDMTHMAGMSSWGMLGAHLLAALLCGLWLAQGESALFKTVRACADRAFVPLRLVLAVLCPPPAPPSPRPAPRPRWRLRQLLLVHVLTTRGPPGETAVV